MELHHPRPTNKRPSEWFTGDVYGTPIASPNGPSRLSASMARFAPGGRTNWHRHAVGQTLYVTEGVGLVGIRSGEVHRIRPGDTVVCPADEDHWHGATADDFMSHVAMLDFLPDGEDPTTWLEPVSDEDYERAQAAS